MDEVNEILCEKCKTKMIRDELSPRRSLDVFYGSTNITDSSAATSVTTYPYGTRTIPTISGTGHRTSDIINQRSPIKIRNYTCPSCDWKTQVRE